MTKKEYLLKLFDKLEPHFDFVAGLRILIMNDKIDNEALGLIFQVFSDSLKNYENINEHKKIQNSIDIIKQIKNTENDKFSKEFNNIDILLDELF